MIEIIRKRQTILIEEYAVEYTWNDSPGSGFSFPCNKQGDILLENMPPEARANLAKCQDGTYDVTLIGFKDYSHPYREPALGKCTCGEIVELSDFTNTCTCGLAYNTGGQLLAPSSQWQEKDY